MESHALVGSSLWTLSCNVMRPHTCCERKVLDGEV